MQNKGSNYFYDQKIRIGGIAPQTVSKTTTEKPDIQFFPEGGELVNGVRSRIAVKCTGTNGLGEDIKGTIQDNTGNVVADFASQHLGMGTFALIPEAGKTYKAIVTLPGESKYSIDLPKAKAEGYTLTINNNEADSIYLKITTNEQTLIRDKDKTFYIIAQSNGKVYYTTGQTGKPQLYGQNRKEKISNRHHPIHPVRSKWKSCSRTDRIYPK